MNRMLIKTPGRLYLKPSLRDPSFFFFPHCAVSRPSLMNRLAMGGELNDLHMSCSAVGIQSFTNLKPCG